MGAGPDVLRELLRALSWAQVRAGFAVRRKGGELTRSSGHVHATLLVSVLSCRAFIRSNYVPPGTSLNKHTCVGFLAFAWKLKEDSILLQK